MRAARRGQSGLTIVEVLVTLTVFAILAAGVVATYQVSGYLNKDASRIERALLLAQDLHEEMRAVPFDGSAAPPEEGTPRPLRLGSFIAYADYADSPPVDLIGREATGGTGLGREVTIHRYTPQERTRVQPPMTQPMGEYAEAKIRVLAVDREEPVLEARFIRAEAR